MHHPIEHSFKADSRGVDLQSRQPDIALLSEVFYNPLGAVVPDIEVPSLELANTLLQFPFELALNLCEKLLNAVLYELFLLEDFPPHLLFTLRQINELHPLGC